MCWWRARSSDGRPRADNVTDGLAGEIHFYSIGADYGAFSNLAPCGRAMKRSLAVLCSVVGAVFWPAVSLACSGPRAGEVIAGNQRASFLIFLAGAVAAIQLGVRFRAHPKKGAWLGGLALLSLLHPIWWLSAMSGDCGYLLFYSSIAVGLVQLAIVVAGHVRLRRGQGGV
jgi:hypothetical protein